MEQNAWVWVPANNNVFLSGKDELSDYYSAIVGGDVVDVAFLDEDYLGVFFIKDNAECEKHEGIECECEDFSTFYGKLARKWLND